MAYRAEIEIGVRGVKELGEFRNKLDGLANKVDSFNKKKLNVANLDTYSEALRKAKETLGQTEIMLDKAGKATGFYKQNLDAFVTALLTSNNAQEISNKLIQDEIQKRGAAIQALKAYNAEAAAATPRGAATTMAGAYLRGSFKGADQFAGPIGPGPASPTALSSPLPASSRFFGGTQFSGQIGPGPVSSILGGQSSPVAERISQQLRDQAKLKASLLALDEKSAAAAQQRLKLSTQLKEELTDITIAARTGPRAPEGFSSKAGRESVRRKQIMQEGAEFVAQEEAKRKAAIEGQNKVAEFAKKNEAVVFGIKAKNIRRTFELAVDRILEEAKAKNKVLDENFKKQKEIDKKALADFDKRLNAEVKAKEQAAKDVRKAEKKIEDQAFKERKARRAKLKDAVGSGLIGGAFPLLFGQGGGAAIGGGLGGFAGGLAGGQMGFALSLVGTQFGAFVDQIVSGAATLGQALNPLTADIDALAKAAGIAGTETGNALTAIQQLGSEQQALEAATALLATTVGNEGVEALRQFGTDTQELSNAFGRAMSLMQAAAAQLFGDIAKLAAAAVSDAVDLQAGLKNINDPRLKKLRAERADLQTNDGEGAFVGEKTEENLRRIKEINQEIIDIVAANRIEVEKTIQAEGRRLKNAEILGQFGEKDIKLQKIKNSLAGVEKDFTDENFVSLQRQLIQRTKELSLDKARVLVGKDENGQIRDNGLLAKLRARINQIALNEEKELNKNIDKALEAKNKKLASGIEKINRQNKQLLQQKQQAEAVTNQLERQLAQSKVAGSVEAQKLSIEAKYEQTMERISRLKNQDFAVDQAALADQIRKTELANLETAEAKRQADAIRNAAAPIKNIRQNQEANLAASREYNRLLMEGVLPSEAKRIVEFNKQVNAQIQQVEQAILITELDILRAKTNNATTAALEEQLELLRKQKQAIEGEASKGPGKSDTSDRKIIEDRVAKLRGELTEMTKLGNIAVKVADNVGAAFSTAFQDVINGSKSTQEALSDMFRTIGENFIAMAADIIAKQIQMIILQTILKALGAVAGASSGPNPNSAGVTSVLDSGGFTTGNLADAAVATPLRANGGPAEGGRPYMVGERGPELFVPSQSGGVMRNEDMRQLMGRSPAAANAPQMNFTFETTNIGGTEFVSREQLEVAMATTRRQAASDGAKQGMSMTLDKMQNSPRTRSRVGIR